MKVVIVSDIHGNYDAWSRLPEESYDELWVLGDMVNYGPEPVKIVEEVMAKATLVVQGNHDHAVAHDDDSTWTSKYRALATATRCFTSSVLGEVHRRFLRDLPRHVLVERQGTTFQLVHATPSDPLHGRLGPDAPEWADEIAAAPADVLLVGHTHVPLVRRFGEKVLVNPGSLGQSRSGDSRAHYAVWEDGCFTLKSYEYPVDQTISKMSRMALDPSIREQLSSILRTGRV